MVIGATVAGRVMTGTLEAVPQQLGIGPQQAGAVIELWARHPEQRRQPVKQGSYGPR